MNPTPEQLAFAFAMMTLSRSKANEPSIVPASVLSSLFRIVAITVVGLGTGLLSMTYIEGTIASNGFSQAEIRSFSDPSPVFDNAITKDDAEFDSVTRTALAQ